MTRVKPLAANELGPHEQAMADAARDMMGFVPNDLLIMARWPQLAQAMLPVVDLIYGPGEVSTELKRMVATIASVAGGCQYCVAHTAHGLDRIGVSAEKQAAIWEFDTHPVFSDAERVALDYARAAAQSPSAVDDGHFEKLHAHFSDRQILEITAVIALFGFLNRWNASLGVPLEEAPLSFARENLRGTSWTPGVHAPADGD
jgi:uncharacterized peroxidase-related enzyme